MIPRTAIHLLCFAALASAFGCGRPPLESYDRSCTESTGCVVVVVPDCGPCAGCGDAAISAHELSRFDSEQSVICLWRDTAACGECRPHEAVCEEGHCVLVITDGEGEIVERVPPPGEG